MRAYVENMLRRRVKGRKRSGREKGTGPWLESLESRVMLAGTPFGVTSYTPLGDSPVIIAGPGGLNGMPQFDLNGDGRGDMIVDYGNGIGSASGGNRRSPPSRRCW